MTSGSWKDSDPHELEYGAALAHCQIAYTIGFVVVVRMKKMRNIQFERHVDESHRYRAFL